MTEENCSAAYDLEEGQEVELTTSERVVAGTVTDKSTLHPNDPEAVWEQTTWTIEDVSGDEFEYGVIRGLGSGFPSHIQLHDPTTTGDDVPEYGYLDSVRVKEKA